MPERSATKLPFNVMLLIVLHVAIALPLAYFLNIWADEASTLYTTENGFLHAFQNAAANEKQAPLYFWIISVWRSLNESIFFARLFSIICAGVSIRLFAGLVARLLEPRSAFLATAFFALHPMLIWASLEIRVYALVILFSILLMGLFFDAFWTESHAKSQSTQRLETALFLIVAIVSLYTSYYLGFLLVGFFFALVVTKRWRQAGVFFGLAAVIGLALLPLAISFPSLLSAATGGFQPETNAIEGMRHLWHHAITYILPTDILSDDDPSVVSVVRTWVIRSVVVALGVLVLINRNTISRQTVGLGVISLSIGLCLFFAYLAVGPIYIALRHTSMLFAPLIVFLASLISDISAQWSDRAVKATSLAGGLLVLLSFSYALTNLYPNMTKRGDWARVGEFIEQNERPGQPVIVFTTFDALALPYHYKGVNRILPAEKFFHFAAEAPFGSPDSLRAETEFLISQIPSEAQLIWLAVNEKCISTAACIPLDNYLKANYTIEIEKEFYLERLYLLKRKSL